MMRLKINKIMLAFSVTLVIGCSDFLDVNQNPNSPEIVPPAVILPPVLASAAFANNNELNRFGSTVMDYTYGTAGSPGAYDIYNIDGSNFGNQWRFELYNGALNGAENLIKVAEQAGVKSYSGIAKIMKAYAFTIATDTWGDVPYSEALKGAANTQPRQDKQEDIYKGNATLGIQSLFDLTKAGLTDLAQATAPFPGRDDIVYNGSMSNWIRAGNTLLIKMALQISDREPALATNIINEVITGNTYIVSNAQNMAVNFGSATGSQSPAHVWTNVSLFQNEMTVSTGFVNLLTSLNDPRLNLLVTKPTGTFVTYLNGFAGTLAAPADRSKWSAVVTGAGGVGPVRLITNAQRAFMLAEAALILPGVTLPAGQTSESLYQEGIVAAMNLAGITGTATTGAVGAYFTANPDVVSLTGTIEQQREKIITQKYISLTGNGLEAWNDYRRTGYPNFPEHLNAVGIDGKRPRRAQYINEELERNPKFGTAVLPNVNVWWDVD